MTTIKDVANRAGVSHGTVSNVLNGRGNVSAEKVALVMKVASEMGYQINNQASSLRAGSNNSIACILPALNDDGYQLFYDSFCREIRKIADKSIDLYLTDGCQDTERNLIRRLAGKNYYHIVTVSSLSDAKEYYHFLKTAPERIFFVYRKPSGASVFITTDYYQAGNDTGNTFLKSGLDNISVLARELTSQDVRDFVCGLSTALGGKKNYRLYSTTGKGVYRTAFDVLAGGTRSAVVTLDNGAFQALTAASCLTVPDSPPLIYSLCGETFSFSRNIVPYKMNYSKLGTCLAQKISGYDVSSLNEPLRNPGFSALTDSTKRIPARSPSSINILLLASPSSEALKRLLPHFTRTTGIQVNAAEFSYEETDTILSRPDDLSHFDILRIDLATFPWYGRQLFKPLDELLPDSSFLSPGFDRAVMDVFGKINGLRYAVPFDPGSQLLFYRKDIFCDAILSRLYYEHTGITLSPASTFNEFDRQLTFFSSVQPIEKVRSLAGTTMTTGNTVLIATEFLTRYYALGGRLLHDNHAVHLDEHKAILALEGYMEQLAASLNLRENWWSSSVELFHRGEVAMQISYMNQFNHVAQGGLSASLGYTAIPGGIPQLGGGVIGISRYCKDTPAAITFFEWFCADEIFEQWVLLGGNGAQKQHFSDHHIDLQFPWLATLSDSVNHGIRETQFLDGSPFNLRYAEKIIGMGISHVINGLKSHNEAIKHINRLLK
ncbi:extracellular solute-binding protein [Serratia marcescens]|nr:extracellular solute-binding protein [Serratia marcescens]MBH2865766.1 extracellular solute-binding protein [Serratia marcescens]MBW4239700.1 extracellular solute-binding protein [Enterobacter roggenkampii]